MRSRTALVLLLALGAATFVANGGVVEANLMEARNLTTAREMVAKGNWLSPTMNGELRLEKPPLPTWAAALAMLAFGQDRLALLRLPAALAATLLVFFVYRLTRELTRDDSAPFLAAATAATSFYVFFMARDVSWDIFCHAFMLGAIWQLHRGLARPGPAPGPFAAAGLLLALSILSKGPVAFYALLLPYLVARLASSGLAPFRAHGRGLLLAAAIALAVGAAWPLYVLLSHPEHAAHVARKESTAWVSRNVRSVFHYWSFPAQSGAWAVLATAALVFPYARRRVARLGDYRLLAVWIWTGVLLLSLVPEKKERYLLPVLVPLAILTALYVRSLVLARREAATTRADAAVLRLHGALLSLAALALPVGVFWAVRRNGAAPDPAVTVAGVVVFWALAAMLARATWRLEPLAIWVGTAALVAAACLLPAAEVPKIANTNPRYRPYQELRHRPELAGVPFFRSAEVDGKFLEVVWAIGREVRHWDPRRQPAPPVEPPLVLVSLEPPAELLGPELYARYAVEELGEFDANQGRWGGGALRNHVTLVAPRARAGAARADVAR